VSLAESDGVLNDPLALTIKDDTAAGKQRFVTIGMYTFGALRVVVHTERSSGSRTISVRMADPRERGNYEKSV